MAAVYEQGGTIGRHLASAAAVPTGFDVYGAQKFVALPRVQYVTKARLMLLSGFQALVVAALVFEHVCANPLNGVSDARAAVEVCFRRLSTVFPLEGMSMFTQYATAIRAILNSPILLPHGTASFTPSGAQQLLLRQVSGMTMSYTRSSSNYHRKVFVLEAMRDGFRSSVCVDGMEVWSQERKGKATFSVRKFDSCAPIKAMVYLVVHVVQQPGGEVAPRAVPGLVAVKRAGIMGPSFPCASLPDPLTCMIFVI